MLTVRLARRRERQPNNIRVRSVTQLYRRGSRLVSPMPVRLETQALLRVSDSAGRLVRSEVLPAGAGLHERLAGLTIVSANCAHVGVIAHPRVYELNALLEQQLRSIRERSTLVRGTSESG